VIWKSMITKQSGQSMHKGLNGGLLHRKSAL
jgi:hypothetical protein